jgi:hypothetical protein
MNPTENTSTTISKGTKNNCLLLKRGLILLNGIDKVYQKKLGTLLQMPNFNLRSSVTQIFCDCARDAREKVRVVVRAGAFHPAVNMNVIALCERKLVKAEVTKSVVGIPHPCLEVIKNALTPVEIFRFANAPYNLIDGVNCAGDFAHATLGGSEHNNVPFYYVENFGGRRGRVKALVLKPFQATCNFVQTDTLL